MIIQPPYFAINMSKSFIKEHHDNVTEQPLHRAIVIPGYRYTGLQLHWVI